MARSRTILIAGAGIGGLAAAIAIAKAGLRPVVLERALKLEEIGAGIQLTPNATRALDKLGALDAVRQRAVEARELVIGLGDSGKVLARARLGKAVAARYGAPWLLILRADLQQALHAVASDQVDVSFEFGAEVLDFATHARGVTALAARAGKNEEHLGLALVGADGLWSKLRARLFGAGPPEYRHLVAWRALVPAKSLPAVYAEPVVRLWLGRDAHVVHYPVAGGSAINVVAIFADEWRSAGWDAYADIAAIPNACDRWAEMPQRAVASAKEFRRWALADRPPLERWGEGPVTLLGDAAHPMLPFLAQGAAAAIEDAVVLGRRLKRADEIPSALSAYEAERRARTARLQRAARATGHAYHLGGLARTLRNFMLRWNAHRIVERYDWIYRYGA
ncbi:MAG: FAD-dependent monooxygenase, partial [Xanthobacteraceae bacterium]|nr:FAD-dependent monooxygenase [Xanthobacteraceae bacterium]